MPTSNKTICSVCALWSTSGQIIWAGHKEHSSVALFKCLRLERVALVSTCCIAGLTTSFLSSGNLGMNVELCRNSSLKGICICWRIQTTRVTHEHQRTCETLAVHIMDDNCTSIVNQVHLRIVLSCTPPALNVPIIFRHTPWQTWFSPITSSNIIEKSSYEGLNAMLT